MTITNRRKVEGGSDFYPTPGWMTQALLEQESFNRKKIVWEPACGTGAMSRILTENGLDVYSSDLYDYGFGQPFVNFLETDFNYPYIITNPPYKYADKFVQAGLKQATEKLCLLLRLSFLEGQKRYREIYLENPPSIVYVFSKRATFYPRGIQTAGSGTIAYAWFVWNFPLTKRTEVRWIPPERD